LSDSDAARRHVLLPVLPLREVSLFPEASLSLVVSRPPAVRVLEMAACLERRVLAVAQRDAGVVAPRERDLHEVGTVAVLAEDRLLSEGGHKIELDGLGRARLVAVFGSEALVAQAAPVEEGDPGDEWGPAVEALARYLHAHDDLRAFIDQRRRSKEPMAWVNLACQHLPITATARQRLLESDAPERCLKISRGLDALLRKEKGD
jgi:ATP-dependent Lon protease